MFSFQANKFTLSFGYVFYIRYLEEKFLLCIIVWSDFMFMEK